MNKNFNWGIIGPGRIANNFAKAIKVIDNADVYAVASRNDERAKNFADNYGIKIFTNLMKNQ